jgi:hypothetical protein
MTGAHGFAVVASCLTLGLAGCGGSGSKSEPPVTPPTGAATITVSGTLLAGSTASIVTSVVESRSSYAAGSAFAGYKLYCVTFSSPPAAGSGVVSSLGTVSLTLAAQNVPFGCFILDAADGVVATVVFSVAAQTGQAISVGADVSLGSITVDLALGIAQAAPLSGALVTTTPAGLHCAVGRWRSDVFDPGTDPGPPPLTCSNSTYDLVIFQVPGGPLLMMGEAFNIFVRTATGGVVCGNLAYPVQGGTYANGALSYHFNGDPLSCPTKMANISATFNADCTMMTASIQSVGCGRCEAGSAGSDGCRGCGVVTCSTSTTPGASPLILHKQ